MEHQRRFKSSSTVFLPLASPPPDRPLPLCPPPRSRPVSASTRTRRYHEDMTSVSSVSSTASTVFVAAPSSRSSSPIRHPSAVIEPLSLQQRQEAQEQQQQQQQEEEPLARPDSTIFPLSSPAGPNLQRPMTLAPGDFHALVRRGDVLQYWLPVGMVLRGLPGRSAVPRGHWERLVGLAEDVALADGDPGHLGSRGVNDGVQRQFVTGWCGVDEPLGDREGDRYEGDGYRGR